MQLATVLYRCGYWTARGYANLQISWTSQLMNWTRQLAD